MENDPILDIITLFSDMFDISKTESRNLLKSGGLYINNIKMTENALIDKRHFIDNQCLLRKGKKNHAILKINQDMGVECINL